MWSVDKIFFIFKKKSCIFKQQNMRKKTKQNKIK